MRSNPFEGQLERLARTLTEQFGVQVVCQGDNAWTDGQQIVLPSVPDPLTRRAGDARGHPDPRPASGPASQGEPSEEALERCLIGYLDHELGYVAFSDFQVAEAFTRRHPGFEGLLNVVEDALIERRAMQRWPGVRRNLDMMFEAFTFTTGNRLEITQVCQQTQLDPNRLREHCVVEDPPGGRLFAAARVRIWGPQRARAAGL